MPHSRRDTIAPLDDHWMIARNNSLPMIATNKVLRCELRALVG
ncbi:hypothetical protein [Nitrobacter sp. 62-23]|nr:hypothetical protein [Nitrobacter sp. 62-23]